MPNAIWTDLLDPGVLELAALLPDHIHPTVHTLLVSRPEPGSEPRPRLHAYDDYVFGVIVAATILEDGTFVTQEIDVVITADHLLTVRKTPPGAPPFDITAARASAAAGNDAPGMCLYRIVDSVADNYLDIIDRFDNDIDDLEDEVDTGDPADIRTRIGLLRHNLLHVRRSLTPMRDITRSVLDGRLDTTDRTAFPHDTELHYADAYDKYLRATDGIDLSRDLLAGVRDYVMSKVANDQNELMKKFTVIASMLLFPTFVVGFYGMNFVHMPEYRTSFGYQTVIVILVVSTIAQYVYFRRKRWI